MATIVFCEDDPAIRQLIQVVLRASGHALHFAPDGVAGLALIERVLPDVVFTDMAMPGLDGLQLSDAMKARPHLAHIPIVFLTASAQQAQIAEGYRHGAIDYLTKPFSSAELRAKVATLARVRDGG